MKEKEKGFTEGDFKEHDLAKLAEDSPAKLVQGLVSETRKAMSNAISTWQRYRRKYRRGLRYLSSVATEGQRPLFFTNLIYATVESVRANLTRALPSVVLRPMEQGDEQAAETMGKMLIHSLHKAGLSQAMQMVVFHACITGRGWFKVWFDPSAYHGLGENAIESIAPENLLIDPLAIDYRQARWFIQVHEDVPIEFIKATYGKYPQTVDNDGGHAGHAGENRQPTSIGKVCTVYECWLQVWEETEEGMGAIPRWLIITMAGQTVLDKKYSEYRHNKPPFVPFSPVTDDGADNAYQVGVGEIEEIEPLQDKMDWIDKSIQKNINLVINRQRFINPASGINPNTMDNTPGRTYLVNGRPQDAVLWDNPPSLGMEIFGYRQTIESQMQSVSGVFDVTQGRRPVGIQAARAIVSLQEAAAIRFMHKQRMLGNAILSVAELCVENILQFYTEERVIRLQGGTQLHILGSYPDALAMPEGATPEIIHQINQMRAMFRQENGIALVLEDIDFNFDIMVDTDSPLPASRQERAQLAVDLFRLGVLDRKGVLDALDWTDKEAILTRLSAETTGKLAGQEGDMQNQMMQAMQQMGIDPMMAQQALAQQGGQAPQQPENYGIMR